MRFLFVHHADPLSERVWSGTPLHIIRALESEGHHVAVINNLKPVGTLLTRFKGQLYSRLQKKVFNVNRDPRIARLRARGANQRIRAMGAVDAILVVHLGDSAYLETDIPVIAVQDSTWYQLLDYYPGYERKNLHRETLDGGVYLDRLGLRRCAHAIYNSSWGANSAMTLYGIDPSKVSVCPFGANLENPPPRSEVSAFLRRRGKQPCKLFFLGKEWYRKGGDRAVSIAAAVRQRGIDVELHVVGVKPDGQIPDFLVPHGPLWKQHAGDLKKLLGLFEESDFFILPTRAECCAVVFSEAAAYGLPVITCDTGGVGEVVRGSWGIALPPNAPAADYASWIAENFLDRAKYESLAWQARDAFERELNWDAVVKHIIAVTEKVRRIPTGCAPLGHPAGEPRLVPGSERTSGINA
jgi:glycosyltransferase involved in cell wall biosynthesis